MQRIKISSQRTTGTTEGEVRVFSGEWGIIVHHREDNHVDSYVFSIKDVDFPDKIKIGTKVLFEEDASPRDEPRAKDIKIEHSITTD